MSPFLKHKAIILLILFFNISSVFSQTLNGIYKIGGNLPDFDSISHAIDTLVKYGVSGPVYFEIRDGIYNERIVVPEIFGVNSTNRIEFRSENGSKENVTIQFNPDDLGDGYFEDGFWRYVIKLDGADYISFKNITIINLTSYEGNVIQFENSCNYNRFENNKIEASLEEGYSDVILVNATDSSDNYNEFLNNEFLNGYNAIVLYGSYDWEADSIFAYDSSNLVVGNLFKNQSAGISAELSYNLEISSNTIIQDGLESLGYGIECRSNLGTKILKNKVISDGAGLGIRISSCGSQSYPGLIANNFIYLSGEGSSTGLSVFESSYQNIYYNTLRVETDYDGGGEGSRGENSGVQIEEGNNNKFLNNLVYLKEGSVINIAPSNSVSHLNSNNYYYESGNIGNWDGNSAYDLAQWQSASGLDANSLSIAPAFIEEKDFHTFNHLLNAKGTPLAEVTTDLDEELRDSATPDIGADEYTPPANDAGVTEFISPILPLNQGNHEIIIKLKNFGVNPLTSVLIAWTNNGVAKTPISWTGNLTVGEEVEVSLGAENIQNYPQISNLLIWTSQPNNENDEYTKNDTLKTTLAAGLSGNYSIGKTGSDFETINAAVAIADEYGIESAVLFNLKDGVFNEQIIIPYLPGTNESNTITFKSESGDSSKVIIEYDSDYFDGDYILELNSSEFVNFNNITFKTISSESWSSRIIYIKNHTANIQFKGCVFEGINEDGLCCSDAANVYCEDIGDNLYFLNNHFKNGSYGIYMNGYLEGEYASNINIANNIFTNQNEYIIKILQVDSTIISNNIFSNNRQADIVALDILYCNTNIKVINNIIITNGGKGIQLSNCYGAEGRESLVANNMISIGNGSSSRGIDLYRAKYINLYYNSVNVKCTNKFYSFGLYAYDSDSCKIFNNNIVNNGQLRSFYISSSEGIESNYNNFYTNDENNNLGLWNGEDIYGIKDFPQGTNKHSLNIDPEFISDTNLHTFNYFFNSRAISIPEISSDIDGDFRNALTPDIGADEFDLLKTDAGILSIDKLGTDPQNIKVNLINFGDDTLKNVTIQWEMDGIAQEEYLWEGFLLTGKKQNLVIGQKNLPINISYSIKAWTSMPNGIEDMNTKNDTAVIENGVVRYSGIYIIGGTDYDFPDFTSAVDSITKYGISGPVLFKVNDGEYNEQFTLNEIYGALDSNSVVFESMSGDSSKVILYYEATGSSDNYVVKIDGADGITFKNIGFKSINQTYGRIIDIRNNSFNIKIKNCKLEGVPDPGSQTSIVYGYFAYLETIEISNNLFLNGTSALYFRSCRSEKFKIKYNRCLQQYGTCINLYYINYPLVIVGNYIKSDVNTSARGINLNQSRENIYIDKNYISARGYEGLGIFNCKASEKDPSIIANNFIHTEGSYQGSLYINSSAYIGIYFNNIFNSNPNSGNHHTLYLDGNHYSVLNNNIIGKLGYAMYVNGSFSVFDTCNYNNFYVDTLASGRIGFINSNSIKTFREWKLSGLDLNSLSVDPLFFSDSNLHVREYALDKKGIPVNGISTDFDGELRHPLQPDIGADEFGDYANDVGITKIVPEKGCELGDAEEITIFLKNYGNESQSGFDVSYIINGADTITENIGSLTMLSGESIEYSFVHKFNFTINENYEIEAFTSLIGDQETMNDTIKVSFKNVTSFDFIVDANKTICEGEGVNISAYGAEIYYWSSGVYESTAFVKPEETTTYYVTGRNNLGCIETDSVIVIVNQLPEKPIINIGGPVEFCNGGFVILTSNIPIDIAWSTNETSVSILADKSGDYFVRHTDYNSCSSFSDTIRVTEDIGPEIQIIPREDICQGDTVQLSVSGGISYNWSTGESTNKIEVWPANTTEYTLITETYMGCTYYDTVNVNVFPSVQPEEIIYTVPENNANSIDIPVRFSWMQTGYAVSYDLYVWHKDSIEPLEPNVKNITALSYDYSDENFTYGDTVNWEIHAKNACYETEGQVWQFSTRKLPDLHVSAVSTSQVNSGATIDVSWTVVNDGEGATIEGEWYDRIWFSPYIGLNGYAFENKLLGIFQNPTSLNVGESYQQTQQVTLPDDLIGTFYLFVITDAYDIFNIQYEGNTNPPIPYNPPPYWNGVSIIDNHPQVDYVKEVSDYHPLNTGHTYVYNDNFYYIELNFPVSPLPDLKPVNINVPENAFSGNTIDISWTVINAGNENLASNHWSDRIYLSQDEEFAENNSILLGTFPYSEELLINDSYTQNKIIKLPDNTFGEYYVYVVSDYYDNVFEHLNESNNTLRSAQKLNIVLTPPPDLLVVDMVYPGSAHNYQRVQIEWEVNNQGAAVPEGSSWLDYIYLSKSPDYNLDGAICVKKVLQKYSLESLSSYHSSVLIDIPKKIMNEYYVYIKVDGRNDIYEHTNENNNLLRSATPINIQPPDLIVQNIQVPDSVNSGDYITIEWEIANAGKGGLEEVFKVKDEIYISQDENFNLENSTLLYVENWEQELKSNEGIKFLQTINIPEGISGIYYIHIRTDATNAIFEEDESNNISSKKIANVKLSEWPDLVPVNMIIPSNLIAGSSVIVKYSVSNSGLEDISFTNWKDEIYISKYSLLNENAILIGEIEQERSLSVSAIYSDSLELTIPFDIEPGFYYVFLKTDGSDKIYEYTDELNNILRANQQYIEEHPPINLAVTSFSVPTAANSGKPVSFSYTVKNVGEYKTITESWNDILYLSNDSIPDITDYKISSKRIEKQLLPGETYSYEGKATIPNGISGSYYAIIKTDVNNKHQDVNVNDNIQYNILPVTLSPSPDLELSNIKIPANIKTGAPFEISWQVSNKGNIALENTTWVDKIVISSDNILDDSDYELYSKSKNSKLDINESYYDTVTVNLSHQFEGNYYIFIITDYTNKIYEHQAEENNQYSGIILVQKSEPSDIIVSEINSPAEISITENISVNWKLKNVGNHPAQGYVKDIICLSKDTVWDALDPVIGEYQSYINLLQMQETTRSITEKVNTASIGENYILVKTDVYNRIYEVNDTNNTAYSDTVVVKTEELVLGLTKNAVLSNNQPKYYQLTISSEKEGETLLATLKGDSLYGNNELYIRLGELPTRVDYDYKYPSHFLGNQEIIIPELHVGAYYILAYGASSESNEQDIELLAEILPFKILSINSNKGGNTGKVTVQIKGSKFEEDMQIKLKKGSEEQIAIQRKYINRYMMYATFDLNDAEIGLYDLQLINSVQDTALLKNGFEIENGIENIDNNSGLYLICNGEQYKPGSGDLNNYFKAPSSVRTNRVFSFVIYYRNDGNIDIPVPHKILVSLDKAPIALNIEELDKNKLELNLELREGGCPLDILRPGAEGSIAIRTKSVTPEFVEILRYYFME